jgi:hypothetical protein
MRARIPRRQAVRPLFLLLAASVAIAGSGCLEFEQERFIVVLEPKRNEAHALLLYDGLHSSKGWDENDLEHSKELLRAMFKDRQAFYFGQSLLYVNLAREEKGPGKEVIQFCRKHLAVNGAGLALNRQGKLCGYQSVFIRDLDGFVQGLNRGISMISLEFTNQTLREPKERREWDAESLRLLSKAAKTDFNWLNVEDGRVNFTIPGTPTFFKNVKREILRRDLLGFLERCVAPLPSERTMRAGIRDIELFIDWASDNTWSFDQRPDHCILSLGVGGGNPIEFTTPRGVAPKPTLDKELLAYASEICPKLPTEFEPDKIVAKFLDEHKTPKPDGR